MDDKPILIEKFNTGIAESPYRGFAEFRNIDVINHSGAAVLTPTLLSSASNSVSGTFTANASTDILTGPDMSYVVDGTSYIGLRAVTVSNSGGGLPAPLAANTLYWIVQQTTTTYKLATSLANAVANTTIDITTAGTGTQTITTVNPGVFNYIKYDNTNAQYYSQDENGRIWQQNGVLWYLVGGNTLENGNTVTTNAGGSGKGLDIFQNYVVAFRNSAQDFYGPISSSTPVWTNAVTTLNGGSGVHKSLVGQDDILYWGDDVTFNPSIGSLQQKAGKTFDPTDSTTYTFNATALTLPKYKKVTALTELGVNLEIGTLGKEIYPWDRSSATFALPIVSPESNITALINVNNQLYFAAGAKGNIYIFNGYLAQSFKQFPKHLLANDYNSATVGAMAAFGRKILFTLQTTGNSGVYSIDVLTQALVMENTISSGGVGSSNALVIPSLVSDGTTYYVGWKDTDAGTNNIDVSSDTGVYRYPSSAGAYIVTQNLDIGYFNEPRTLQNCEIYLDRPLLSNQSIVLSYRTQLSGAFTALATFSGDGTNQVFQTSAATISGTDVQFKIGIIGTSTTTPYLQSLRII